jgi:hypothetical protein
MPIEWAFAATARRKSNDVFCCIVKVVFVCFGLEKKGGRERLVVF